MTPAIAIATCLGVFSAIVELRRALNGSTFPGVSRELAYATCESPWREWADRSPCGQAPLRHNCQPEWPLVYGVTL